MKANLKHFSPLLVAIAITIALVISLTACASLPTPSPSQVVPPASQPIASAAAPATSPSQTVPPIAQPSTSTPTQSSIPAGQPPRRGAGGGGGGGVNGTLAKIDNNTLTLNTQQTQTVVNITSTTAIQKTVSGTLSDLQTGQFLTVRGTAGAGDNITASSISIRTQDQNRPTPPAGAPPNPGGGPGGAPGSRPNNGGPGGAPGPRPDNGGPGGAPGLRPDNGGPGNGTQGILVKIDGNTLTLTTGQGQQITVTVSSSTTFDKMVTGTKADLQVGQALSVNAAPDANDTINAVSINIRPQGPSN